MFVTPLDAATMMPKEFCAFSSRSYRLVVEIARLEWCSDQSMACLNEDFKLVGVGS